MIFHYFVLLLCSTIYSMELRTVRDLTMQKSKQLQNKYNNCCDIEVTSEPKVESRYIKSWLEFYKYNSKTKDKIACSCLLGCEACSFLFTTGCFIFSIYNYHDNPAVLAWQIPLYVCSWTFNITCLSQGWLKTKYIAYKENKKLQEATHFYSSLIKKINKQKIEKVRDILIPQPPFPLDLIFNGQGHTPLLAAIQMHNPQKDPKALIIKHLIAQGASLWYEEKENGKEEVTDNQMEEGLQQRKIKPHNQPMLMVVNNKHLHNKILKPLCRLAQTKKKKRKKKYVFYENELETID